MHMTKEEARLIVRTMLKEYEGDDYTQLVEDMKEAIKEVNLTIEENGQSNTIERL